MKRFLARPSVRAFLAFAGTYACALAFIFWGTWSLDRAPVEPDNPITYAIDDAARWCAGVLAGGRFIPSDLMHVVGGMYFWQELQYALAAFLAALGVAFYLRGRRLSLLACYGGGAAFGLMGYCFTLFSAGHMGWFVWLMYGPFAFGLTDRAVRKGRWINWALLGTVLAWASAQQPDLWLLFTALTFAYGTWCLVRERRTLAWGRLFAGVALTAVVAGAVGGPQFAKAIFEDVANREAQMAGVTGKGDAKAPVSGEERWNFCTSWSMPPEDTLEFAIPDVHGASNDPRVSPKNPYKGRLGQRVVVPEARGGRHPVTGEMLKPGDVCWMPYRQHSLYFGFLTLLLAGVGVVAGWRRRKTDARWADVPFWTLAAAVVYLCALGGFTPFYRLVYHLPFGDAIRCPVKFVHLLEFCAAALAGYGLAALQTRFAAAKWVTPVLAAVCVLNVADLARVDAGYLAVEQVGFQRGDNAAAADVVRLGGGKTFVAVPAQEGGRLFADSFGLHLAETTENEAEARFVFATGSALGAGSPLSERLRKGEVTCVGTYVFSQKGIQAAPQQQARAALLQVVGKEAAPKPPAPPPVRGRQAATWLSIVTQLVVCACAVRIACRKGRCA